VEELDEERNPSKVYVSAPNISTMNNFFIMNVDDRIQLEFGKTTKTDQALQKLYETEVFASNTNVNMRWGNKKSYGSQESMKKQMIGKIMPCTEYKCRMLA